MMGVERKLDLTLMTNYGNCTKIEIRICVKNHGYLIYSELIYGGKKMGVERKVDLTLWQQIMGIVQKVD